MSPFLNGSAKVPGAMIDGRAAEFTKPMIVYVVDDDAPFRESLRLLLEVRGYPVQEFEDGEQLFRGADLSRHSCVVTDVNLPGSSGIAILTRLRGEHAAIPVIVVSGRSSPQVRREALALGAAAFFEKPVPASDLFVVLDRVGARH